MRTSVPSRLGVLDAETAHECAVQWLIVTTVILAVLWAALSYVAVRFGATGARMKPYAPVAAILAAGISATYILTATRAAIPVATTSVASAPGHDVRCAHTLTPSQGVASGAIDGIRSVPDVRMITDGAIVQRNRVLNVIGWASDAEKKHPIISVCLFVDGVAPRESATYGQSRPDVARAFNQPELDATGFAITVGAGDLPTGRHRVTIVGVDSAGRGQAIGPALQITIR